MPAARSCRAASRRHTRRRKPPRRPWNGHDDDGDELLEHWGDPKYSREERIQLAGMLGAFARRGNGDRRSDGGRHCGGRTAMGNVVRKRRSWAPLLVCGVLLAARRCLSRRSSRWASRRAISPQAATRMRPWRRRRASSASWPRTFSGQGRGPLPPSVHGAGRRLGEEREPAAAAANDHHAGPAFRGGV